MNLENLRQLAALHARGTLLTDEAVRELVEGVKGLLAMVEACREAGMSIEPREGGGGYVINNARALAAEAELGALSWGDGGGA